MASEHVPPCYVDKLLLPARIMLPGPEQLTGSFALSASSPVRDGPESLVELLNSGARVLPVIRSNDDAVMLLSRLSIDSVEVGADVQPAWVRPQNFVVTREELILVRLLDGRRLEGRVSIELPEHLNRVSDFLNLAEDFFALATRSCTMLINKSRVSVVRLYGHSPSPVAHGSESGSP